MNDSLNNKMMLIAQLMDSMNESAKQMGIAYAENDKRKFEMSKQALLELQTKLDFMLRRK